jgi:hypothetical protein
MKLENYLQRIHYTGPLAPTEATLRQPWLIPCGSRFGRAIWCGNSHRCSVLKMRN